ncbi:hypothetical protein ACYSNR_03095 [Enterococcus sp. LJL128]
MRRKYPYQRGCKTLRRNSKALERLLIDAQKQIVGTGKDKYGNLHDSVIIDEIKRLAAEHVGHRSERGNAAMVEFIAAILKIS